MLLIKGFKTVCLLFILALGAGSVQASEEAILTAYSLVARYPSLLKQYHHYKSSHRNAAARALLTSDKIFVCPRDTKVEVVKMEKTIAKVKLHRLDANAKPVSLYFWTLSERLKPLPQSRAN